MRDPGFCAEGPRWRISSKSTTSNHSQRGEDFLRPRSHRWEGLAPPMASFAGELSSFLLLAGDAVSPGPLRRGGCRWDCIAVLGPVCASG